VRLDPLTVARGAAFGLVLAVPAALVSLVLSAQDHRSQGLLALTYLLVVVAFGIAGFAAATLAAHRERHHGLAAAVAAWVPVEVIAVLGRLDRGDPVSLLALIYLFAFALVAGNVGAGIAVRRRAGRAVS